MTFAPRNGLSRITQQCPRTDHILNGLTLTGHLDRDSNARLHVDVLKVSHHGSASSNTKTFFETITADHYVISAGHHSKHANPDPVVLDWIAESQPTSTVWLTNDSNGAMSNLEHLRITGTRR